MSALSTTPEPPYYAVIFASTTTDEILVAAKVEFDSALTFAELSVTIDVTESNVRRVVPAARVIYIEPDVRREPGDAAHTISADTDAGPTDH